jgi:hypothetical protein
MLCLTIKDGRQKTEEDEIHYLIFMYLVHYANTLLFQALPLPLLKERIEERCFWR